MISRRRRAQHPLARPPSRPVMASFVQLGRKSDNGRGRGVVDEVYEFLIEFLRGIAPSARHWNDNHHCDLWLTNVALEFAQRRGETPASGPDGSYDKHFSALHDSVWELCRVGVLRPGRAEPYQGVGASDYGDKGYSITRFGRIWLKDAATRPIVDPSRLGQTLGKFTKFGPGYIQRATEAVRTYRTCNYLSACVMSGAAAESILLALAIAKEGDEEKVLATYKTASGRGRVKAHLLAGVTPGLVKQFEAAIQLLHYWRDDAGHGTATSIDEIEAHASLTQLLRLAQIASAH